jgi:hypothetical protein
MSLWLYEGFWISVYGSIKISDWFSMNSVSYVRSGSKMCTNTDVVRFYYFAFPAFRQQKKSIIKCDMLDPPVIEVEPR